MKQLLLVMTLLLLAADTSTAQRWEREGREPGEMQMFLLYEPLFVPGADSSSAGILIPYRIDLDFFIAIRSRSAPPDRPFTRKGELMIELFDSTGTSAARFIEPVEALTATTERLPGNRTWYEGIATLQAPPGHYRVLVEINDLQSKRTFAERYRMIRASRWQPGTLALSTPFFVKGASEVTLPDTLRLENLGEDFLFGSKASLAFLLNGTDTSGMQLSWRLTPENEAKNMRADSNSRFAARKGVTLKAGKDTGGVFVTAAPGKNSTLVTVPLPLVQLPLRNYTLSLTLTRGAAKESTVTHFRALWPDMPASLRDVDRAIDALRLLVPEDKLDRMRRGDFERKRDSLEAFWNARDTDRTAPYNGLMAEYYRRVDYASLNYGTLRQADGSRTDRGRIYILYGPPSSTERTLKTTGAFREVWVYSKLGRTFVFEDQSRSGNYVLIPSNGS